MHPYGFESMLATATAAKGDGWAFEPMLDGWRAMVHVAEEHVSVYSRPGRDFTADLPQLSGLVGAVPAGTVLDGDLVAGSVGHPASINCRKVWTYAVVPEPEAPAT